MRPLLRPLPLALLAVLALTGCKKDEVTDDTDTDTDVEEPLFPDAASDYALRHGSYLSVLDVPPPLEDPCCRDFGEISRDRINNGTDEIDNAIAALNKTLELVSGGRANFETPIENSIRLGGYVPLLDFRDLPKGDGDFTLAVLTGAFAEGTNYAAAKEGDGTFLLEPETFDGTSGTPLNVFESASVTGGRLLASNGTMEIPLPLGFARLYLPMTRVKLEGDVTSTADGVTLANGELSGALKVDDWFEGYNQVVSDNCGCAELTGDLYTRYGGIWQANCLEAAQGTCTGPTAVACGVLLLGQIDEGGICNAMYDAITAAADLNFDDDESDFEGLSVGLRVTGVTAVSDGLVEAAAE